MTQGDASLQGQTILHGIGVSTGIVIAKTWSRHRQISEIPNRNIAPVGVKAEIARVNDALEKSRLQLEKLQTYLASNLGQDQAAIIDFHMMMLEDDELKEKILKHITRDLFCAEHSTYLAISENIRFLLAQDDDYLKARADDLRDVCRRIIRNLMNEEDEELPPEGNGPVVLVADDLTPSEAAHLNPQLIAAFITCKGSRTSHAAILARALGIPAIVAVRENMSGIASGLPVALDVSKGLAVINPDKETILHFRSLEERQKFLQSTLANESGQPTETLDGYQACLVANVELPTEALKVREKYNVGIGLFRTEFLFIDRGRLLTEEEQFSAYRETVQSVYPHSVIFRTLDVGGDKFISQVTLPHEINPFMGTRAIRFSLSRPDIFKTQLRAILRASAFGKVRVMFPMISAVEELRKALEYLDEVKRQLYSEGIAFNDELDVGCMIEVPSAALLAERLIKYVDFFSIGTNDLVQYSLAVDRANSDIAYLYQPAHPAVIRQIKHVADAVFSEGKWVSVCGEMAGETLYTPLLLGMGIQELSMSPVALAPVHKLIRSIRMHEAEQLLAQALKCNDGREVEALCTTFLRNCCPELLPR